MTLELTGIAACQVRVADLQSRLGGTGGPGQPGTYRAERLPGKQTPWDRTLQRRVEVRSDDTATSPATTTATGPRSGVGVPTLDGSPFDGSALGSTTPGGSGQAVVRAASRYLGVPYVWGGTTAAGLDCSGLVQKAYGDLGITLPRVAADQARVGSPVASLAQAKPGDLLAFGSPVDHIAIYIGDNRMIAAPQPGQNVKIQSVYATPVAIRRVISDNAVGGRFAGAALATSGPLLAAAGAPAGSALAEAPAPFAALFRQAEARYGVPATLLAAVAKQESGFNPGAVSSAGAIGLMQIMPATAQGLRINPRDPAQAVDGAARLLRDHLRTFGSTSLALAAYNAGPGAVQRYGGIPPYAETRDYVRRITADPGVRA